MQPSLDLEIRQRLAQYAAGAISLAEFRAWFVPATWDLDDTAGPDSNQMAYDIENLYAEYTDGYWTEPELREQVLQVAQASAAI
jgi:hypothetical protein